MGRLLILGGPSAVGKTTLLHLLLARRPGAAVVLTTTTRAPRPAEADGVDYHFISAAAFAAALAAGDMLEHTRYAGVDYGIARREVEALLAALRRAPPAELVAIAVLDVRGVAFFREWLRPGGPGGVPGGVPDAAAGGGGGGGGGDASGAAPSPVSMLALYVDAPEADVERRLAARGSSAEEVERRLRHARERERTAEYVAAYDAVVRNPDGALELEQAFADIAARLA